MGKLQWILGKLIHADHTIPTGCYFLNRLRHLMTWCKYYGPQRLIPYHREYPQLWIIILEVLIQQRVSINNIVCTKYTITLHLEGIEYRVGVYTDKGLVWIHRLPLQLRGKFFLNLLEFLSYSITIHRNNKQIGRYHNILSALQWMHKVYFGTTTQPVQYKFPRYLCWTIICVSSSFYYQHILVVRNIVSDSLSRYI